MSIARARDASLSYKLQRLRDSNNARLSGSDHATQHLAFPSRSSVLIPPCKPLLRRLAPRNSVISLILFRGWVGTYQLQRPELARARYQRTEDSHDEIAYPEELPAALKGACRGLPDRASRDRLGSAADDNTYIGEAVVADAKVLGLPWNVSLWKTQVVSQAPAVRSPPNSQTPISQACWMFNSCRRARTARITRPTPRPRSPMSR